MSKTTRYNLDARTEPANARPHHVNPSVSSTRVILTVKNFSKIPGVCHIGLGVTALNTIKVLRRNGINAEAWAVETYQQLADRVAAETLAVTNGRALPISHVIVSAPSWISPAQFGTLCFTHNDIEFVLLNHSGAAYLSIDKFGIRNIRGTIALQESTHNMRVASNNYRVSRWLSESFGFQCATLPNLYDTQTFVEPIRPNPRGDTLRIGSFGAGRPWKNQLIAAEAAVQLASRLGCQLELYVNAKRPDGGERMIESRRELFDNLPGCKLVEVDWARWPQFRDITATMHILFQPSFDETFNVVTADGIAEGVPSITTSAIEWTPESWWCDPADPSSLLPIAISQLNDPHAVVEARAKLRHYVMNGIGSWVDFVLHRDSVVL